MLKNVIEDRKIRKVLITCHTLKIYSGSDMVTLDIAMQFKEVGVEPVCAAFVTGDPVEQLFISHSIPIVNLIKHPGELLGLSFDLVWAHHWPVVGFCLAELRLRYRYLVASSLSAYEPLEVVSVLQSFSDVVVCNSESTKAAHLRDSGWGCENKFVVMNNSLNEEWFIACGIAKSRLGLKELAVISNHVPMEVAGAIELLRRKGVVVTLIGVETKQCIVDLETIRSFDAVVTIGHSVQKCLAAGVPVYCYDRFGGPGWISSVNINEAEVNNYSGRCCNRKLSAKDIASEIFDGFKNMSEHITTNFELARERYSLSKNIESVIRRFNCEAKARQLTPANNTLRKITQIYLREKFSIDIPSVLNITEPLRSDTPCLATLKFIPVEKNLWDSHLAYFGINTLPAVCCLNLVMVSVGGIALSKQDQNGVVEVAIFAIEEKIATARLSIPSPGVGKCFPELNDSSNAGFSIPLGRALKSGTYRLVVALREGQELQVGQIVVSELRSGD